MIDIGRCKSGSIVNDTNPYKLLNKMRKTEKQLAMTTIFLMWKDRKKFVRLPLGMAKKTPKFGKYSCQLLHCKALQLLFFIMNVCRVICSSKLIYRPSTTKGMKIQASHERKDYNLFISFCKNSFVMLKLNPCFFQNISTFTKNTLLTHETLETGEAKQIKIEIKEFHLQ